MPALSKKHFDLQATLSLREECKTQVLENSAVNKKMGMDSRIHCNSFV